MSLFEIVLGFVLTTMIGFVLVFPIYLVEKYIVLSILDEYIDNVILLVLCSFFRFKSHCGCSSQCSFLSRWVCNHL